MTDTSSNATPSSNMTNVMEDLEVLVNDSTNSVLSIALYKDTTAIANITTVDGELADFVKSHHYLNREAVFIHVYDTNSTGETRLMMTMPVSQMDCNDTGNYTCAVNYQENDVFTTYATDSKDFNGINFLFFN